MYNKFLTIFYSSVSTFSNLAAGLITFVVLARVLDKQLFGDYIFYNSLAIIAEVLIDFGIAQKFLREGRLNMPKINELYLNNLILKAFIFLIVFAIYFTIVIGVMRYDLYSILIFFTVTCFSFFQFSTVFFRVSENYKLEAIITLISSTFFVLACIYILYQTQNIYAICITLLSVRLLSFLISLLLINRKVNLSFKFSFTYLKKLIFESLPYLTDRIVSVLYSNVDTIVIKYYIGSIGVAVYNSGLKLANGSLGVSAILSNIYIPKISLMNYANEGAFENQKIYKELWILLASIGFIIALVFSFFNELISKLIFADKFDTLPKLLPLFGLFVCERMLASYYGIILTSIGLQSERAKANAISLVMMIVFGIILTSALGLKGTLFSLVLTTFFLIMFYLYTLNKNQFKHLHIKETFIVLIILTIIIWTRL